MKYIFRYCKYIYIYIFTFHRQWFRFRSMIRIREAITFMKRSFQSMSEPRSFITNQNSVAYLLVRGDVCHIIASHFTGALQIFPASIGLCQFLSFSLGLSLLLYCSTVYWRFGAAVMTCIKSVFERIPAFQETTKKNK